MRISKSIFFFFLLILVNSCFAQKELDIQTSDNAELIKALNSARLIADNREPNISVRIYKLDNGTGSAGSPSSEVSYNLLVAISAFDQEPEQNLFEIGPFYNPKFVSWQVHQKYEKEFVLEYGPYNERESLRVGVNLQSLWIIE